MACDLKIKETCFDSIFTKLFILITALMVFLSLEVTASDFTDNGDGTVTDNRTDLIWQQEDDNIKRDWKEAIRFCEDSTFAGYDDWRLSSYKELRSIVDFNKYDPAIDEIFLNTNSDGYWTSNTCMSSKYKAWYVDFLNSYAHTYYKSSKYYVRCVRGGQ